MGLLKTREQRLVRDFRNRGTRRQQIQNQRHPNALAANARLAEASLWIDPDSLK
jgi:hypothetical protein